MNCFSRVSVLIAVPICRHGTKMESHPTEQLWILCVTVRSFFWIRNYVTNWYIFFDRFNVYQRRREVGFTIFTSRQRSCVKVMFSVVSVSMLFRGGHLHFEDFHRQWVIMKKFFVTHVCNHGKKAFVNQWLISKHTLTWLSVGADSQLWRFVSELSVHCVRTVKGLLWYLIQWVGLQGPFHRPPGLGTIPHRVLI